MDEFIMGAAAVRAASFSGTGVDNATRTGDEEEPQATWYQKKAYWTSAMVILWVGAACLVYLFRVWRRKESPLHSRVFQPFWILIMGDYLFTFISFGPYHTFNVIFSQTTGKDPMEWSGKLCKAMSFLAIFGLVTILFGVVIVWVSLLQVIKDMAAFGRHGYNPRRYNTIGLACCFVITMVWWTYAWTTDTQGGNLGLYCSISLMDFGNSLIAVLLISVAFTCVVIFAYKSFFLLKTSMPSDVGDGTSTPQSNRQQKKVIKNIASLAFVSTVTYTICWGLLGMACFMTVLGIEYSNPFIIIASLFIKFRPTLDVIMLLRSPMYLDAKKRMTSRRKRCIHPDTLHTAASTLDPGSAGPE